MKADALFVIAMIVFVFFAWVATGGPTRPIATAGPYITPVRRANEESQGYRLQAPASQNTVGATTGGTRSGSGSGSTISSGSSPYRNSVYLDYSVLGPMNSNPNQEYVSINAISGNAVTITGWKLTSKSTGNSVTIPGGAASYRSGTVNASGPVVLSPGDKAIILTGRSPVGASFKENICTGYLGQYQTFIPDLNRSCPSPADEISARYTGADKEVCATTAENIPRCAVVTSSTAGGTCGTFLKDNLNYNSCVTSHRNDSTFTLKTWRLYLDRNTELWGKARETITLYDQNGKVVDTFSY